MTTYIIQPRRAGAGGGSGDVTGPASSTNTNIAVFSGTTGKVIADGGQAISAIATTAEQRAQIERSRISAGKNYNSFIDAFCATASAATIRAEVDPTSIYPTLHSHIVQNVIGRVTAQGNNSTALHRWGGMDDVWSEGTLTARAIASTNDVTRSRRLGVVSPALTTSVCGFYCSNAGFFIGDGTRGGFTFYAKFTISDAALVSTARMFVGVSSDVSIVTNVDPSAMTNSIGFGRGNTQNTLRLYYGGSAAQTAIDLGANFPTNTTATDIYEVGIFAMPKLTNKVGIFVRRTLTGDTYHNLLTAGTPGLQLPLNTTALGAPRMWRSTNGTATAVGFDIFEAMIGY